MCYRMTDPVFVVHRNMLLSVLAVRCCNAKEEMKMKRLGLGLLPGHQAHLLFYVFGLVFSAAEFQDSCKNCTKMNLFRILV